MKTNLLIAFLLLFSISQATAQRVDSPGGPAKPEDLPGIWKLVPLSNASKINKVNPWPLPYQWFRFYEDGTVASMMRTGDGDYSTKELESLFATVKKGAPSYGWRGGFLVIRYPDTKAEEVWGVNHFSRDVDTPAAKIRKGDIMMTLAGGSDGAPVYFRLLRKVTK